MRMRGSASGRRRSCSSPPLATRTARSRRSFHLSEQTVHNYRANIMEKLGLHDRMELLKFAIRRGIVSVADL